MSNTQQIKLFRIVRLLCRDLGPIEVGEIVAYIISKSDKKFSRAKFIAENPCFIDGKAFW